MNRIVLIVMTGLILSAPLLAQTGGLSKSRADRRDAPRRVERESDDSPPRAYYGEDIGDYGPMSDAPPRGWSRYKGEEPDTGQSEATKAKRTMSVKEIAKYYGEFKPEQMPFESRFTFDGWTIPGKTLCANSRSTKPKKVTCTACAKGTAKKPRGLSGYTLNDAEAGTESYVFHFEGTSGPLTLTCAPKDAWQNVPDAIASLEEIGVTVELPYPQEAKLNPRSAEPRTAPTSH